MRETSSCTGIRAGARLVALAAERQPLDRDLELEPPALAGREAQRREVELRCELGHRHQASARLPLLTARS